MKKQIELSCTDVSFTEMCISTRLLGAVKTSPKTFVADMFPEVGASDTIYDENTFTFWGALGGGGGHTIYVERHQSSTCRSAKLRL